MNDATAATSRYVDAFATHESTLPGHHLAWLRDVRRAGIDAFSRSGFPTPRNEHWKYTNVSPIEKRTFDLAPPSSRIAIDSLGGRLPSGDHAPRLVFVDGQVDRELSDTRTMPSGIRLEDLARCIDRDSGFLEGRLAEIVRTDKTAFTALNAAFMDTGAVIRVDPETVSERPVHLVFVSGTVERDRAYSPRVVIAAGAGSRIAVVEHYIGLADTVYLVNAVTEVDIGAGATVEHYRVQQESAGAYHVAALEARLAAESSFRSWAVSLGARLARHDIDVALDHEHARCSLDGLYLANGRQHVDFHTNVEHIAPHCESHEYYKGIAGGRGRGVFNGRVHVHPDAQKTEAHQTNRNLLLSRNAEIDTKPQLEIHADDVKCSHGATIGQLDEQMLFYLRARGIAESMARGMLTYGFARDVVDRIACPELRESIGAAVLEHLPGGDGLREILQ